MLHSIVLRFMTMLAIGMLCAGLTACDQTDRSALSPVPHTTITALVWAPDWAGQMLEIADRFNHKNPDISVNVQFMIGNSVEQNIKPRVAAAVLPDLISVNPNSYTAQLANQGLLVDLSHTNAWRNTLDSLKPDWTSSTGKHFGISTGIATTLMYYNKTMFARAGVTHLPVNFAEFLQTCEKLKRAGFVPIVWNGGFPNMLGNGPFSFGFGNNVVADDGEWKRKLAEGSLDLNTAKVADIFDKIQIIADRGYAQEGYLNTKYDEGIQLFVEGKTAMAFQGNWAAGRLMKGKNFETGVFIPPWNAPGKEVVPVVGSETGFAVCDTPNQKATLRFLEFIADEGFVIMQNQRHNISPFRHHADAGKTDAQIAAYTTLVRSQPKTVGLYYSFLPANTIEALHSLISQVLIHQVSPIEAARMLDESVRREAALYDSRITRE